jgi:N-acyl-D-amino-acid deacylase
MPTYDLLIVNATLVDGTGAPGRLAGVAVRDDTIVNIGVAVGDLPPDAAGQIVDGSGLVLSPGFIDMHAHSDRTLLLDPTAESKVRQGVTTEVIGNCGSSPTPYLGAVVDDESARFERWGVTPTWQTMGQYLDVLADRGVGINVVALVGHGSVRKATMGYAMRAPDASELTTIRRHVAESMAGGAFGMSFGGIYPPSNYATTEELIEASKEVAAAGGIYACHMRNERERLLDAVNESIRIGRESGAAVQISHHKASSPRVWGLVKESLKLIEQANTEGVPVTVDQYPYRASSTNLNAMMPGWAHEGGLSALSVRLRDPEQRARILEDLRSDQPSGTGANLKPSDIVIASCRTDRSLDGKTIAQIAEERDADPDETVLNVLSENLCDIGAIFFSMSEDDVRYVMRHPLMTVGSDATSMVIGGKTAEGKPHPRTYGTFARILGQYVRDEGVLSLEEAVAKMTGRCAQKLGLVDRGTIEVGKKADLVLFSAERVREVATFENPHQYAEGVELVVLNGRIAVEGERHTGTLAGRVLRHR